jgi:hypothetical protein
MVEGRYFRVFLGEESVKGWFLLGKRGSRVWSSRSLATMLDLWDLTADSLCEELEVSSERREKWLCTYIFGICDFGSSRHS